MKADSREERQSSGWRSRDVFRVLALIAAFYIALQLLWAGRSVILLTFLGVLLGLVLGAGVDWLERRKVPRSIGTALLALGFFGVLGGIAALTAPSIAGQLGALRTRLPEAVGQVEEWIQRRERGMTRLLTPDTPADSTAPAGRRTGRREAEPRSAAQDSATAAGGGQAGVSLRQGIAQQIAGIWQNTFAVFSSTLAVLGGLVLIIFVAIFVALDTRTYHRGLMHLFPHRMRADAGEVLSATAMMLRRWLLTQAVGMVVIGVLTTIVLLALGVEAALALGIIAGLLEFIPIVGPILSAVPAVAMAFLDGPQMAMYVVIAYIIIQQAEANLIYPLLMKKGLEIPPVLTIVAQGVMSLVFGFVGLLVAVPLLAGVIVPIKMLYVRDVVGDPVKLPGEAPTG